MLPVIEFRYSQVYDRRWKGLLSLQNGGILEYPTPQYIQKYITEKEGVWKVNEDRILSGISEITGLQWQDERIRCYFVRRCRPFSDPLTLMPFNSDDKLIDNLSHELVHQIFIQNSDRASAAWSFFREKYREESKVTVNHIILYAVLIKLYKSMSQYDRLVELQSNLSDKDYTRAWEIAQDEGYDMIIADLKSNYKVL